MDLKIIVLVFIGILIGGLLAVFFLRPSEKKTVQFVETSETVSREIPLVDTPTKCFSCENQFAPEEAWRGRPTKCFECEKQFVNTLGHEAGVFGQPSKFY
jgi:hypothetical protein